MVLQKIHGKFDDVFRSKEDLNLTEGPVTKNLFYLSLPIIVMNLLQTAYNIADTFWLGQLSDVALAAITYAFPLVFFLISLGMGLSVAGSVLVAQYEGKGDRKKVDFAASQTITFSLLASLILGSLGYTVIGKIVSLMGASSGAEAAATGYLQIISGGLFFMFGFFVFMSLMRGFGDTVTPMLLMFGSVALNIILDPFLIFGWSIFPAMGVKGAAVATVFSRGLAMLVGLWILFTGRKGVEINLSQMYPDLTFFKKMLKIGIPASIEGTGRSISVNLLVAVVGLTFAQTVVSGYGIAVRIFSLIFLPATAVGKGVETMTGQNLGAGNTERAEEAANAGAKYTFAILTGIGVITFLFAYPISSVFTKSPEVAAVSAEFLRYVSFSFGFIGILRSYTGSFRGAGATIKAAIISVGALGAIRLPIAAVGAQTIGTIGVWLGFLASNTLGAIAAYLWYRKGSWKKKEITEQDRQKGEVAEDTEDFGGTISDHLSTQIKRIRDLLT